MQGLEQFYSVYQEAALHLINTQVGTANYLLRPQLPTEQKRDASVFTNEELWANVLPQMRCYALAWY